MSFILEALKKSEQQRLQQNTPQQEVCKRTLFLCSRRSSRRYYWWMVAGFLPLVLISGWWFYSRIEPATLAPSPSVNGANHAPSSHGQPMQPESTPVPDDSVSAPPPLPEACSADATPVILEESRAPVEPPPIVRGSTPRKILETAVQGMTIVSKQPEVRISKNPPLYQDLSKELLDRIPRLIMSMHYHSSDPGRRLVRINDRLLHEGDWLSSELHVVEITPTGAILDFLGKSFVMHSPIR